MSLLCETKGILVVDDEPAVRSVVSKVLSDAGYNTFPASDGHTALNILSKEKIDLAVVDIKMPILDGEGLLGVIKSKYPDIDVIMITAYATIESAVECLKQGAYDYILKPLNLDALTNTVNRCMGKQILLKQLTDEKKLRKKMIGLYDQLDELFLGTVRSLADAIELKDVYTAGHCERMRKYALMIADSITLGKQEKKDLEYAAILHDIGKIAIPEKILLKPGKLSDDDWQIVRQHPLKGTQILLPIKQLKGSILGIKYHHERYDGTGYPENLKGGKIPLIARILFVADAFDAMTSDRPYRKALSFDHAKGELLKHSGSQFDPALAKAFVNLI